MRKYRIEWDEFYSPGKGLKLRWEHKVASYLVNGENAGDATKVIKKHLGEWHIQKFKCQNFRAYEVKT
jgi:hypothetical protein